MNVDSDQLELDEVCISFHKLIRLQIIYGEWELLIMQKPELSNRTHIHSPASWLMTLSFQVSSEFHVSKLARRLHAIVVNIIWVGLHYHNCGSKALIMSDVLGIQCVRVEPDSLICLINKALLWNAEVLLIKKWKHWINVFSITVYVQVCILFRNILSPYFSVPHYALSVTSVA